MQAHRQHLLLSWDSHVWVWLWLAQCLEQAEVCRPSHWQPRWLTVRFGSTLSQSKLLQNHTLHSGTCLYSPCMAVSPPRSRFFCTFLCSHCITTTWNDQILSLLRNGNGKAINSTLSVWTRARSPLFSSSQNPLLLNNRANWDNRENFKKDAKSMFQWRFHGRRRCRIIRSLFTRKRHWKNQGEISEGKDP